MLINLKSTNHTFEKVNLVGIVDRYVCSCGLKARREHLSEYVVADGRVARRKVENCPNARTHKQVTITACNAVGPHFENLVAGSTHTVIDPPEGENNSNGVWVMGVGQPVKVLFGEFEDS